MMIEIKDYYTITLNGCFLTEDITGVPITEVPYFMTQNIDEIGETMLFEDYNEAVEQRDRIFSHHKLMQTRQDELKIESIKKYIKTNRLQKLIEM